MRKYKFILRNKDNSIISGKRISMLLGSSFLLFILLVCFWFWFACCRNSYLLAKARLISISSALRSYQTDNGNFPGFDSIDQKSISNYLTAVPEDPWTGADKIVESYDGTGGWVYDADNRMLKINSVQWWNPYTWGHPLAVKFDKPPKNKLLHAR